MKSIFLTVVIQENGKNFAFVEVFRCGQNIKPMIERYKNAHIWHLCESRKQADNLAQFWNDCYKNNGTYLYGRA